MGITGHPAVPRERDRLAGFHSDVSRPARALAAAADGDPVVRLLGERERERARLHPNVSGLAPTAPPRPDASPLHHAQAWRLDDYLATSPAATSITGHPGRVPERDRLGGDYGHGAPLALAPVAVTNDGRTAE